ncbi:hypothetical protein [Saccharopolyspora spinosa]|uniref:hypothetical protein n=1 Tax=Saccharopolyspora spinosa TaxID=60894 RepID=UPI0020130A39|nr:hypothetical protein [Saccharopolyspora spinosa]
MDGFDIVQYAAGVLQEQRSGFGQLDPARVPVEEVDAQLTLEVTDALGQRR